MKKFTHLHSPGIYVHRDKVLLFARYRVVDYPVIRLKIVGLSRIAGHAAATGASRATTASARTIRISITPAAPATARTA